MYAYQEYMKHDSYWQRWRAGRFFIVSGEAYLEMEVPDSRSPPLITVVRENDSFCDLAVLGDKRLCAHQ